MMKWNLFLTLFFVDYLKEILIPEMNKLLKHPMDLGEFIRWLGCWFYMGCWVVISKRMNCWSTGEPTMSESAPFRLNTYKSRTIFEVTLGYIRYTYQKYVEYYDGLLHMHKIK